ncbi:hypothetical protein SAMD00023353_12500080 [Rosellinia necatrix]|uniref:Uncharacterized protein n=1 Tax=Rosellinia necatrix TaxID=77044 RepID=A0A1W2TXH1_ROSNE|nr:hypothetical protein SAMD00023353_12500080 [Rosellinia necatrix]
MTWRSRARRATDISGYVRRGHRDGRHIMRVNTHIICHKSTPRASSNGRHARPGVRVAPHAPHLRGIRTFVIAATGSPSPAGDLPAARVVVHCTIQPRSPCGSCDGAGLSLKSRFARDLGIAWTLVVENYRRQEPRRPVRQAGRPPPAQRVGCLARIWESQLPDALAWATTESPDEARPLSRALVVVGLPGWGGFGHRPVSIASRCSKYSGERGLAQVSF